MRILFPRNSARHSGGGGGVGGTRVSMEGTFPESGYRELGRRKRVPTTETQGQSGDVPSSRWSAEDSSWESRLLAGPRTCQ